MRTLLCTLFVSGLMIGLAMSILHVSGELLSARDIAHRQVSEGGVYGTAINKNTYRYKIALVEAIRPQVAAFGSSRVMQFRARYFTNSFVNLGGAGNSPYELQAAVSDVLRISPPEVAIVGVDFWWFNKRVGVETTFTDHAVSGDELNWDKLFEPYRLVRSGRLRPQHAKHVFLSPRTMLGLQAFGDGFGPDGSYYYTSLLGGKKPNQDKGFALMLSRIQREDSIFKKFGDFDEPALTALLSGIGELKNAGVKVITFLPPLSPQTFRALRERDKSFEYLARLNSALTAASDRHFDLTDAGVLASNDCEFVDGIHGGEVTYARIVAYMSNSYADLVLANAQEVMRALTRRIGYASVSNASPDQFVEIDSLGLGCTRTLAPIRLHSTLNSRAGIA